jgi:uncharacterized protein (DUF2141 family)
MTRNTSQLTHTAYRIPLIAFYFLLLSCARIVAPTGGPKDVTPPKVIAEKPENGSVNFIEKKIKITFDEFVTLNNPIENIIFSPPVKGNIDYSTQGKSVVVKIQDTLQKNTTYNIFFSDCIQDFHEGNKLDGYNYAFSTGDSIDKHKIFGMVKNAETNKPEAGCFVMLYKDNVDSLPLTNSPDYLTKTNEQGKFYFHHLKPNNYKIFALRDINSDYKYNLPNELIAFADNTFEAKYYETDSLFRTDTTAFITLRMFQEADTVQLLLPYLNPQKGLYRFPYKIPVQEFDFQIKNDIDIDYFLIINPTKDTLSLYLKTFFKDSAIVYLHADFQIDTIELLPYKTPVRAGRNQPTASSTLSISLSNKEELFLPTLLNFSYPIKPVNSAELLIIATTRGGKDTTSIFVTIQDTFVMKIPVPFKFEPKINYTIMFRDSLFFGYDNTANDSTMFTLSKKTERDYGNLIINYKMDANCNVDFIVELQSSNQKTVRKEILSSSKTLEYNYLSPGIYKLKITEDKNRNGKWDTGNYRKKLQPEKIFFIDKEITVRGFWDIEEDIELRVP